MAALRLVCRAIGALPAPEAMTAIILAGLGGKARPQSAV